MKRGRKKMALKMILGALAGAAFGYVVIHKLIGCATGTCPITANPYTSTIYGALMGLLLAGGV